MKVTIEQAALSSVLNNDAIGAAIGAELLAHANEFVADSKEAIRIQRQPTDTRSPGPNPFRQTGALQTSIETEGPIIEDTGRHTGNLVVYVVSNNNVVQPTEPGSRAASKRTGEYSHHLLNGTGRGGVTYRFVSDSAKAKLTDDD